MQMKCTQYFSLTRERDDRKDIKLDWIEFVFNNPVLKSCNPTEELEDGAMLKKFIYS